MTTKVATSKKTVNMFYEIYDNDRLVYETEQLQF